MLVRRIQLANLQDRLRPNKVVVVYGPRRVGKTVLLRQLIDELREPYLLLNGEAMRTTEVLARRTPANYRSLLGDRRILLIDEAQEGARNRADP
jgi:predicted AAA+ superfamily ATPase